jgi:hypothetical protein
MKEETHDPRTPVMILVEVSWEDHSGTAQRVRARIENKSAGGACIRLSKKISVGTRLRTEGQWEKFAGETRYCRKDGREYLVGVQRDRTERPIVERLAGKLGSATVNALPDVTAMMETAREREASKLTEVIEKKRAPQGVPTRSSADGIVTSAVHETVRETWSDERRRNAQVQRLEELQKKEECIQRSSGGQ